MNAGLFNAIARIGLLALLAAVQSACGGFQNRPQPVEPQQVVSEARGPEENRRLHTDLIRQMIDEDKLYAAMAHLDAQEQQFGQTDETRLLRADVKRKLDLTIEAEAIYRELLSTPYEGYAQHGLGLIYVQDNLGLGTEYLQRAVRQRPTDARMHNDLGYALLRQGHVKQAKVHLGTAYELGNQAPLLRNNYVVALLADGERREASRLARESDMDVETFRDLQRRASKFGAATGMETLDTPAGTAASADVPRAAAVIGGGGG